MGTDSIGRIGKWNGSSWSTVGPYIEDYWVSALAVSASDLYVGGDFGITKWNENGWSEIALYSGPDGPLAALAVSGSDLYVGGYLNAAGGVSVNRVAKWNGSIWSTVGSGMDEHIRALAVSGRDLYAGGDFTSGRRSVGQSDRQMEREQLERAGLRGERECGELCDCAGGVRQQSLRGRRFHHSGRGVGQ